MELENAAKARTYALDPVVREAMQRSTSARISMAPPSPTSSRRRDGLLGTTILEEVEDTDEDFDF